MIGVARKWGMRVATAFALTALGYGAAGMVGGAIPANPGWREPARGITVYVASNGIHTDIVVPKAAAGVDWRGIAQAGDLGDPRFAAYGWLAVGFGEHAFYLQTPRWADVRPGTLAWAAIGSDRTLVHLDHLPEPTASSAVRAIRLTPHQYRRLSAFLLASIAPGGARYRGYGGYDAFYQARGHYDLIATCNAWAGDALRYAGVRVGWWTPFPITVLGWFPPDQRGAAPAP